MTPQSEAPHPDEAGRAAGDTPPEPAAYTPDGGSPDADSHGARSPGPPDEAPTPRRPERRPLNTSGWVALALAAVAFGGSVLIAWTPAVLLAALAMALSITGVIRVYRGRATNRAAALTALGLALATILLGFVWADRAQPCVPLTDNGEEFKACYESRTGLL